MTDRLFLTELVREIGPAIRGSRTRSVRTNPSGRVVTVSLSHPGGVLVFHLGRGAPGFYRGTENEPGKPSPRETKLTKWLASAVVTSVVASELDRVVTVHLEQTRLSGKKKAIAFVFEIVATRASLFVVDCATNRIVDCFSNGGSRLATGERFFDLAPPPHASALARDGEEFERRLAETQGDGKDALLLATGFTPLLVKEMQYSTENEGKSTRSAFDILHKRLQHPHAILYMAKLANPRKGRVALLSPILLESESELVAHPMASFNDAMAEAVRLSGRIDQIRALRQRLDSALARRLKRARALQAKLRKQRDTLREPDELRKRGETLLAGLARAERVSDTIVRLPDPFDPDGGKVEIAIDPRFDLAANAERLFRRSRKAERTRTELEKRLEDVERELTHAEGAALDLADASELEELESLEREAEEQGVIAPERMRSRSPKRAEKLPPRKFLTSRGHVVLVGRSARSNEDLTFRIAKPDDLWFHASGVPGSHVVLKGSSSASAKLDEEDVLHAAALAARFSKARNDSYVEVMLTERRNVSKVKGAPPGLVKVAKVRTLRVKPAVDVDVR